MEAVECIRAWLITGDKLLHPWHYTNWENIGISPVKSRVLFAKTCTVENGLAESIAIAMELGAEFVAVSETWPSVNTRIIQPI